MKTLVSLGDKIVSLNVRDFDDEIDVDQLLSIDYSNLYGEAVTISALLNQMGILKAQAEKVYNEKKLELEVFEAGLRKKLRKESIDSAQKITESGLNELVSLDEDYQTMRKNLNSSKFNLDITDNLWWSVKSKDQKLNNLVKGVTPVELFDEIVEGTVNNILIKKHKPVISK